MIMLSHRPMALEGRRRHAVFEDRVIESSLKATQTACDVM